MSSHRVHNALVGVGVFYASMWALSLLDSSGKWLLGIGLPLISMIWVRYLSHVVLLLAIVLPRHGLSVFKTRTLKFQIWRGVIMLAATLTLFTAMHYLPQAQATAIAFLAPLIMLALAPLMLGEKNRLAPWIAAVIGFIGVLIIVRPSAGLNPIGVACGLATAFFFGIQHIINRRLIQESAFTTLLWSGIVGAIGMTVLFVATWVKSAPFLAELTWPQWLLLISMGFSGGVGHLLQIKAYHYAPASFLAPFMYLQITAAAALGWLIWGQFPDTVTWIGIAIICASGIGIAMYERWASRRRSALEAA